MSTKYFFTLKVTPPLRVASWVRNQNKQRGIELNFFFLSIEPKFDNIAIEKETLDKSIAKLHSIIDVENPRF